MTQGSDLQRVVSGVVRDLVEAARAQRADGRLTDTGLQALTFRAGRRIVAHVSAAPADGRAALLPAVVTAMLLTVAELLSEEVRGAGAPDGAERQPGAGP
jgi:hypothetical protein